MLENARRIALTLVTILLVALLLSAAPGANAFNRQTGDKSAGNVPADDSAKPQNISFPLYAGLVLDSRNPESEPAGNVPRAPIPSPPPPPVSTAPMTPGEKFKLFARKSFRPPSPYALSIFSGVIGEATDGDHGRHMSTGDFLADSMTHAARGFAFRATSNFFEKFAFATVLRQDPRYHRSDKKRTGAKLLYALTRIFVTQGDRCGCDQVNASFLAGGLAAAGVSHLWVREEDKTVGRIFRTWGSHIAVRGFLNVLSEFIGGQ